MAPDIPDNTEASSFIDQCEQWLCDGYSMTARYIASESAGELRLFDSLIFLNPLPLAAERLHLTVPSLSVGQERVDSATKDVSLTTVRRAISGAIVVNGRELCLPKEGPYSFQPGLVDQNTWFMPLSLKVNGGTGATLPDRDALDNALRASTPPFDGAEDLRAWLGLRLPDSSSLSTIAVVINPPIDLMTDRSTLLGGVLHLVLHAHPNADRSRVRIAVREAPGEGLSGRTQVAGQIEWRGVMDGRVEGTVDLPLKDATGALVMLLIGSVTVRRHWFIDPAKSPNIRYAAVSQFDRDLHMIRRSLFDDTDPGKFENAVAALLFLMGFSPSVQLETDSPDIVVATPVGKLVVVECTTRVADVRAKIGKLVDRREALQRKLRADNTSVVVSAALVCRVPRDQIAAQISDLRALRVILVCGEEINEGLNRAWGTTNPDDVLDQALRALTAE